MQAKGAEVLHVENRSSGWGERLYSANIRSVRAVLMEVGPPRVSCHVIPKKMECQKKMCSSRSETGCVFSNDVEKDPVGRAAVRCGILCATICSMKHRNIRKKGNV